MRYDPDKRCATYCGDDRCNCEAGPMNPVSLGSPESVLAAGLVGLGMDPKQAADYAAAHAPATHTMTLNLTPEEMAALEELSGPDWKARALAAEAENQALTNTIDGLTFQGETLKAERDEAQGDRDEYRDLLHDLVMLDAEEWAIGGGPGFKERSEKAWSRARERLEP